MPHVACIAAWIFYAARVKIQHEMENLPRESPPLCAHHTRLDCVMASAALMRQAFVEALRHVRERMVFGKLLIDQPLMRNVLADLAIESEAATLLLMRLARAFDKNDRAFARIGSLSGSIGRRSGRRRLVRTKPLRDRRDSKGRLEVAPQNLRP